MDLKELRQRARRARDELTREKLQLLATVVERQARQAEDRITHRIKTAQEDLEKQTRQAADHGHDRAILVRLSPQLYDLRQVALEELSRSAQRSPDPYPRLRQEGPFSFLDIDRWVRTEMKCPDPERTSPLRWLDDLARWVLRRSQSKGLSRWLGGGPPVTGALADLYNECKRRGLKPSFDFYEQIDDKGIALVVSW